MSPGDIASIYQKPLTDEGHEGEAALVKLLATEEGKGERWLVKFVADGGMAERLVCERNIVKSRR